MNNAIRIVFFAALVSLSLIQAEAQSSTQPSRIQDVTIHVKIVQPSGRPAPQGLMVELRNQTGMEVTRIMTDSRGMVDFANLTPAPYIVALHQLGYEERQSRIDMTYSPSMTVYIDAVSTAKADNSGMLPPGGPGDTISANLPASEEGRKALDLGNVALFERKDAAASLEYFKKLNKSDPDYSNGWVLTGTALSNLNKNDEAEKAFRKALQKAPESYPANFGLGMVLNQLGRFEDALKPLQKSLQLKADSVEALYEISRSDLALNRWQDAEPHTIKAIALAPNFAPAHISMGNIYLRKRDAPSALKEFQTYLSLDPNGPFAPQTREIANKIKAALKIN